MPNERQLTLHSPALSGSQALLVRRIEGREGLSQLFSYDVTLYAKSENVDFSQVLGHEMCVGLELPSQRGGGERYFHGYVASFGNVGTDGEFSVYRAELRPHLWRLTRATNCRIFQGATVPEIVEGILKEYGVDVEPNYGGGNRTEYLPWSYCVQYRETDFAFISRLLEHEGIHYFFRHEEKKHTLVLADSNAHHDPIKSYDKVEYTRVHNQENRRDECIWEWRVTSSVLPDKVTLTDYDFREPKKGLVGESGSEVERDHGKATPSEYEVYDHLETVVQQDGYSAQLSADYARMRSEEMHVRYAVISAQTDARGLCAGASFKVERGPDATQKSDYIVVRTEVSAEMDVRSSSAGGGAGNVYHCWFEAIDKKHPYRPARATPKPIIPGPQSAIVAGPPGSKDIATDEWGRIYVKFHWARKVKADDKDLSCWVRVSQNSAGANWGSMFVPHIGQEVLVGFIEGDPDRPVVIGRVYNGLNKTPLTLPDYKYKSTIRDHYSNEITFDGTPGDEHMLFYSPSHRSALILGKSVQDFTTSKKKSYSYDSEAYHFGTKLSFTKGSSFSVDRGFFASVKAGVGASLTVGTDLKLGAAANIEFKGGVAVSLSATSSFSFGYGREFKTTKGTYRRSSSEDAVLDSQKTVFVTGGENDNTMLASNDKELTLSYDDGVSIRAAQTKMADGKAKAALALIAGTAGVLSVAGAGLAQFEITRKGEQRSPDDAIKSIRADTDKVSGMALSDIPVALGAVASIVGPILATKGIDIESPEHPSPSAKVRLSKEVVEIFAGKAREAQFVLKASTGVILDSKKKIAVSSEKEVNVTSGTAIKLSAKNAVIISGAISHPNLSVSK